MKKAILILAIVLGASPFALARQGENDGDPNHNDGRMITCTDKMTGAVVLQFVSNQAQAQASLVNYDLIVKTRGDDIGEMTILDKRSGDFIKAKRLEELLKTTLGADENPPPVIIEAKTCKGYAETKISNSATGDSAFVKSHSRRGQNSMEVVFLTDENPNSTIGIHCQKIR